MVDKIVTIGAGPAGLTAGYEASKLGIEANIVERASQVGGIARTVVHDGYRVDVGGHRFFTKVPEVEKIWRDVLNEDLLIRPRLSRIYYRGRLFVYPLQFRDAFYKLGIVETARILLSYIQARLMPCPSENTFEDWVSNRFGHRLYRTFFKSYTEKVWGIPCNKISALWAAQRIQTLSLPRAVLNSLIPQRNGKIKSLIQQFLYPRLGPGMLWERVAQLVEESGGHVILNAEVVRVIHDHGDVKSVEIRMGPNTKLISGDAFVSSMPIGELVEKLDPPVPAHVRAAANSLTYRDFLVVALIIARRDVFPDNWICVHDPDVMDGRIQNFKNWSQEMVPDPTMTCLGLEYFCSTDDPLWKLEDEKLVDFAGAELERIGLVNLSDIRDGFVVRQTKAYPIYTGEYETHLQQIREYLDTLGNLQTVGRNGLHMYNNQDHSMLTGLLAVRNLLGESHDVWSINVDRAYHEEMEVNRSLAHSQNL